MRTFLSRSSLVLVLLSPLSGWSQVSLSIGIAPPPLLLYAQPPLPGEGYLWTPGYCAWNPSDSGYYWVPGTLVLPPGAGDLWTPGYWAFEDSGYLWHAGYWGRELGFYCGLNYGYGYSGWGYQGGRWEQGGFWYDRAASNVRPGTARLVYGNRPAIAARLGRVSFNGWSAGVSARATGAERQVPAVSNSGPSAPQMAHERDALVVPAQRFSGPREGPLVAATPQPSAFSAPGVEHARRGPVARMNPLGQSRSVGPHAPAQAQFAGRAMPRSSGPPAMVRPQRMAPAAKPQKRSDLPHQGGPRG